MAPDIRTLSTIALFASISAAGFWTIEGHFFRSKPGANMLEYVCPADTTPQQYQYTHIAFPDRLLCMLAEFFQVLFSPHHFKFTVHFITGYSAEVIIFLIEGTRSDKSWLSNPLVIGMVYQTLGAGSTVPLSLLIVILGSRGRARQPLTQPQAESVLLAIVLAYILPTICMFLLLDPKMTVIWQAFPIWQYLLQRFYLAIRPKTMASGFYSAKLALGATIISSFVVHYRLLHSSPVLRAPVAALIEWWPSWTLPDPRFATIESTGYHLLKWDSILSYSACLFAACSFAETWSEALTFLGLAPLGSALLSPGAFLSSLWIYREWRLNQKASAEKQLNEKAGIRRDDKGQTKGA